MLTNWTFNSNVKIPSVVNCPTNTILEAVGPTTPPNAAIAPPVDVKLFPATWSNMSNSVEIPKTLGATTVPVIIPSAAPALEVVPILIGKPKAPPGLFCKIPWAFPGEPSVSSDFKTPNLPAATPPVVNQESINAVFLRTFVVLVAEGFVVAP